MSFGNEHKKKNKELYFLFGLTWNCKGNISRTIKMNLFAFQPKTTKATVMAVLFSMQTFFGKIIDTKRLSNIKLFPNSKCVYVLHSYASINRSYSQDTINYSFGRVGIENLDASL